MRVGRGDWKSADARVGLRDHPCRDHAPPGLPPEVIGRTIEAMSLGDARRLRQPMFVKPPSDKGFEAGVYADGTRLPGPDKLPARTPVQVSEIVTFARE